MTIEEQLAMMGSCIARHVEELESLRRRVAILEDIMYPAEHQSPASANVEPATTLLSTDARPRD